MSTSMSHLQTENGRELQEAIDRLTKGVRDPEAARLSRERMDREREEMRQRIGTVDVVVPFLRDLRD